MHTFLFQEGLWTQKGYYYDDSDSPIPLEGKTRVTHLPGLWVNEGAMELKSGEKPIIVHNRYEIIPFADGRSTTTWKSFHPAIGELMGYFVVVEDAILSSCLSADGRFSGLEFLLKASDAQYANRGVFLKDGLRLSSWSIMLRKIPDGPFPESL
jgi:hypothetical protein